MLYPQVLSLSLAVLYTYSSQGRYSGHHATLVVCLLPLHLAMSTTELCSMYVTTYSTSI